MQLFAQDKNKRLSAHLALKGQDYRCLECLNPVRLRSGPHRQPHFFHLSAHPFCRQAGKTLFHLHTQLYILKRLPPNEAELEVSFVQIGRIADAVWETKKLIFEVQCSPITQEEVQKRNADYESLGYRVIWILHERRFNRRNLTAAEAHLLQKECYFSSIDHKGAGILYDQFAVIRQNKFHFRGPKLPISISDPFYFQEISVDKNSPKELLLRAATRRIGFAGDLFDRAQKAGSKDWASLKHMERAFDKKRSISKRLKAVIFWLKNVYLSFLHALLEKESF